MPAYKHPKGKQFSSVAGPPTTCACRGDTRRVVATARRVKNRTDFTWFSRDKKDFCGEESAPPCRCRILTGAVSFDNGTYSHLPGRQMPLPSRDGTDDRADSALDSSHTRVGPGRLGEPPAGGLSLSCQVQCTTVVSCRFWRRASCSSTCRSGSPCVPAHARASSMLASRLRWHRVHRAQCDRACRRRRAAQGITPVSACPGGWDAARRGVVGRDR